MLSLAKIFEKSIIEQDNKSTNAAQSPSPRKQEAPKEEAAADDDLW